MEASLKLRHLRALVELARAQRITKAALRLNISQPALSRMLHSLEARLGVALFERAAHGMVPSTHGAIIIKAAMRALMQLEEAENEIMGLARRPPANAALARSVADHELNAVISIHKLRSMGRAADQLKISRKAVSRSLREIESRLGRKLFDRSTRFVVPTECGDILARHARLAYFEMQRAKEELAYALDQENASLSIRIGASPLSRGYLVPLAISRLTEDVPNAKITIIEGSYEELIADLLFAEADIIVGTIRANELAKETISEKLYDDGFAIVARADHPLFRRRNIRLADLAHTEWILPHEGIPVRTQFESFMNRQGLSLPTRVIECDSFLVTRSLLMTKDWLAVLSKSHVHFEELHGLFRSLPLDDVKTTLPIGVTLRKDYLPTRCVQVLVKHLRALSAEMLRQR